MHEPDSFQTDNTRLEDHHADPLNITDSFANHNPEISPALSHRLTIKLPPMTANGAGPILNLRRSTRRSLGTENSLPSGSEYQQSDKSMEVDPDADAEGEEEIPSSPQPKVEYTTTGRGRRITKKSYVESESEPDPIALDDIFSDKNKSIRYGGDDGDDEDEDDIGPRRITRRSNRSSRSSQLDGFIVSDDGAGGSRYPTRSRSKKPPPKPKPSTPNGRSRTDAQRAARQARRARRSAKAEQEEDGYIDEEQSPSSPDGEFDDAPHTSEDLEDGDGDVDVDGEVDGGEAEQEGKPYSLRQRAKINYAIPPPLEEMRPVAKSAGGRAGRNGGGGGGRTGAARPAARRGPGWSAGGAELGRWMGMPGDDSVSYDSFLFPYPASHVFC
jgi:ATPase family AAA domain-containing protein 2